MKLLLLAAIFSVAAFAQNPKPCTNVTNTAATGQVLSATRAGSTPPCTWVNDGLPAFTSAQNVGTDSICAKGADGTLLLDGTLKTVTVVTGTDAALPNSGTWTTSGGGGTGATGTFTATAGNLSTITIVNKGVTAYTSNPTFTPSSGALGTSTVAFSGCANQADGTVETAFATTVSLRSGTLANQMVPLSLMMGVISSGTPPTPTMKIRLGGIGGTLIYQSNSAISTTPNIANKVMLLPCRILAIGAASTTTATQTSCVSNGTWAAGIFPNFVPTSTTFTTPANATIQQAITVTLTFAANTAGNVIYLYGISPI